MLDPSENGTPNTLSEHPMGIEAPFRRVEIPLGGQVGEEEQYQGLIMHVSATEMAKFGGKVISGIRGQSRAEEITRILEAETSLFCTLSDRAKPGKCHAHCKETNARSLAYNKTLVKQCWSRTEGIWSDDRLTFSQSLNKQRDEFLFSMFIFLHLDFQSIADETLLQF